MYGLSAYEDRVVATLPPRVRTATVYALQDHDSRPEVRQILNSSDPAGRMVREIELAVKDAMAEQGYPVYGMAGLDAGMGKSLRKRLKHAVKSVVSTVKKIHQKVEAKILPKSIAKLKENVRQKVSDVHKKVVKAQKKVFVKYGSTILLVAGAVLAPFTGGLSLAASAVLTAGLEVYKKKEAARAALRAGKAEANAMAAEVAQQESSVNAQADAVYNGNTEVFTSIGITPTKWASLSLEAKLAIIDALSKGQLPPGYSFVSEEEAAAAGVVGAQAGGGAVPTPVAYPPAPPAYQPAPPAYYGGGGGGSPQYYGGGATPYDGGYSEGGEGEGEEEGVSEGPVEVVINGKSIKVASADDAASVAQNTSVGDRVEIFVNGQSTGLKLKTSGGLIDVPADAAAKVRAMSQEDAVGLANRASAAAGGGKFSMWWLLAVPAALLAAKAA